MSFSPVPPTMRAVRYAQCFFGMFFGAVVLATYLWTLKYIYDAAWLMWNVGTQLDMVLLIDAVLFGVLFASLVAIYAGLGCYHLWQLGWRHQRFWIRRPHSDHDLYF